MSNYIYTGIEYTRVEGLGAHTDLDISQLGVNWPRNEATFYLSQACYMLRQRKMVADRWKGEDNEEENLG